MTILIRQGTEKDIPTLAQIYFHARQQFPWEEDPQELAFFEDTEDEIIFVVEVAGEVVGFLSLYEETNFIHLLFIQENYQGQGLAQALIAEVKNYALGPLTLKCVQGNKRAYQFYLKNNWQVLEENNEAEPSYYLMELV